MFNLGDYISRFFDFKSLNFEKPANLKLQKLFRANESKRFVYEWLRG